MLNSDFKKERMTIPSKDWRDVYCVHSVSVYSDTRERIQYSKLL